MIVLQVFRVPVNHDRPSRCGKQAPHTRRSDVRKSTRPIDAWVGIPRVDGALDGCSARSPTGQKNLQECYADVGRDGDERLCRDMNEVRLMAPHGGAIKVNLTISVPSLWRAR